MNHHIRCIFQVIYSSWAQFTVDFCSLFLVFLSEVAIFGRKTKVFPDATLRLIQGQKFATLATLIGATPAANTIVGIIIINQLSIIT